MLRRLVDPQQFAPSVRAILLGVVAASLSPGAWAANWINNPGNNWSDPANWDGPVPTSAGDVAVLQITPKVSESISLTAPVTLGQLDFVGPSQFMLTGAGPLTFNNPGVDPAALRIRGPAQGASLQQINVPLNVVSDETLAVDVVTNVQLRLDAALNGEGAIHKTGNGSMELTVASPSWMGDFLIGGGTVTARHTGALGAAGGRTVVSTRGTLALASNGLWNEPLHLQGGVLSVPGGGGGGEPQLNGAIELTGQSTINPGSTLVINGSLSGSGGVTYVSNLYYGTYLYGDSSYSGLTTIAQGRVAARHANALGSPNQGTVINSGAELNLEFTSAEPFTIRGGRLNLAPGVTATGPIRHEGGRLTLGRETTLNSPITIDSIVDTVIEGDRSVMTGGVSGSGDLSIGGAVAIRQTPLSHDGALNVLGSYDYHRVELDTANTYTGPTTVGLGTLVVNHSQALGTATSPVTVKGGTLELNQPIQREIQIDDGTLRNNVSNNSLNQAIDLKSGDIRGVGVYDGEIRLSGYQPAIRGGTFQGDISGDAEVAFGFWETLPGQAQEVVHLNANNTFTGVARVQGHVIANAPQAFGAASRSTIVEYDSHLEINAATEERFIVAANGRVDVNVQLPTLPRIVESSSPTWYDGRQTVALNVASNYHEHADVNQGGLEINAPASIDSVTVRNGGRLVAEQGTLTTPSEVTLQKGVVSGRILAAPAIRKTTNEYGGLGNLPGFAGEIVVERGVLQIDSSQAFGTTARPTRVSGSSEAALHIRGAFTTSEDIYLNNATGVDHRGGLYMTAAYYPQDLHINLAGRLDLGDVGSTIGGSSSSLLEINGPITGGSLTKKGSGFRLQIRSDKSTYTGSTEIRQGAIELGGEGRLANTSAIVLHEGEDHSDGMLLIDNGQVNRTDRVADSIPVIFKGGALSFNNPESAATSESFGKFAFDEGFSRIEGGATNWSIARLDRQAGATAEVNVGARLPAVAAPEQADILPWMIVNHGFGRVANGKLATVTAASSIAAAGPSDHVRVAANSTLSAGKTINSLTIQNSAALNLHGNQLEVQSGGILFGYGGSVTNGTLTAGTNSNELIVHSAGEIAASIVDNASGPVGLTVSPIGSTYTLVLSGENSYSGKTAVNWGQLYLASESALPAGADLDIVGGQVQIGYNATAPKHLARVRIAGNGALTQQFTGQRGQGVFEIDETIIEYGAITVAGLVGDGVIYKRTSGSGVIAAQESSFSGDVVVEEGRLRLDGLNQARLVARGGTLEVFNSSSHVTLDGGNLEYLYLTGTIQVESSGRLMAKSPDNARNWGIAGSFVGSGHLTFDNAPAPGQTSNVDLARVANNVAQILGHSPAFHGNVDIRTAVVSARYHDSLGTGDITIYPGGDLQISSNVITTGWQNDVYLQGGQLSGSYGSGVSVPFHGDLYVSGNSFLGTGLRILGDVHLADGSRLATTRGIETRFLGDTLVGGTAELHVTRTVNDAAFGNANVIQLGGRIVSDAPQSVLKIFDSRIDQFVFDASFHVQAGQSLSVLVDNVAPEITLGSGAELSGTGVFLNPVRVAGGVLAPGQSPGVLSFADSLTIGADTVYEWELASALGTAGSDWDLLDVAGPLTFAASALHPWVIEVTGLSALGVPGTVADFDPFAEHRWLIASADSIAGFDPNHVRIEFAGPQSANPTFRRPNFSVEASGGELFLVYQYRVPEPAAALLLALGVLPGLCARQPHRRS